jgi:hypothetical protein
MAVISKIAYEIQETIPGYRQPQGWQERTEHDSDPTHHPFDASPAKVFNVRAQNWIGRPRDIRDRRKVRSRCLIRGDSAATAPIPERPLGTCTSNSPLAGIFLSKQAKAW